MPNSITVKHYLNGPSEVLKNVENVRIKAGPDHQGLTHIVVDFADGTSKQFHVRNGADFEGGL